MKLTEALSLVKELGEKMNQVGGAVPEIMGSLENQLRAKYEEGFLDADKKAIEMILELKEAKGVDINVQDMIDKAVLMATKDMNQKIEQAKLEAMTLNDDEVARLAEKVGFDKGVASVVIPEMPDVDAIKSQAFKEGAASIVCPVDLSLELASSKAEIETLQGSFELEKASLLETAKNEKDQAVLEATKKADSLQLSLELMLNEKSALESALTQEKDLRAQEKFMSDAKIQELESRISDLTKPADPVVVVPEAPVVTEPVVETPVVTEPIVETPVEVPVETPVIPDIPKEDVIQAPVDSGATSGGEATAPTDEKTNVINS